jgi:hypothetical protein
MATDLDGIFNVGLNGCRDRRVFDKWLEELKKAEIPFASYYNEKDEVVQETGEWVCEIDGFGGDDPLNDEPDMPYCVSFYGPYMFQIRIMDDIAQIPTHYRLRVLFEQDDYFIVFISNVHRLLKIFGATELIWLSSLGSASYSAIYQSMVWENVPYDKVKEALIQKYGQPISYHDAKKIGDIDLYEYRTLDKFVLDVIG